MSGDSNGVVVYRTTRLSMIEAVRSAHPAPAGRLRRNKRLSHAELADAILATLPEAEPDPLKAVEAAERIIAARDAEIELMRRDFRSAEKLIGERDAEITRKNGRCDDLFATVRAKEATITELRAESAALREALDPHKISDEEFEQAKAAATARWGRIPPSLQRVIDLGGRFGLAIEHGNEDGLIVVDRADLDARDARVAAMTAALERFAAPGVITATDRRKAASDALGAAQDPQGSTP